MGGVLGRSPSASVCACTSWSPRAPAGRAGDGQVGHHVFADTVALAEHAQEHGIEFGIAMNPYYPPGLRTTW